MARRWQDRSLGRLRTLTRGPALYRAARLAGADPSGAARALVGSFLALTVAATRSPGRPGRQNALRHFVWQAHLTAFHGEQVARAMAAAQEHGTSRPQDSLVDSHNNVAGQQYGAAHAASLRRMPIRSAVRQLADVAERKWQEGRLDAVEPR